MNRERESEKTVPTHINVHTIVIVFCSQRADVYTISVFDFFFRSLPMGLVYNRSFWVETKNFEYRCENSHSRQEKNREQTSAIALKCHFAFERPIDVMCSLMCRWISSSPLFISSFLFIYLPNRNFDAQRICVRSIYKSVWCAQCLSWGRWQNDS